jgi:hypothetical protein
VREGGRNSLKERELQPLWFPILYMPKGSRLTGYIVDKHYRIINRIGHIETAWSRQSCRMRMKSSNDLMIK